jgi:hypothetical protein
MSGVTIAKTVQDLSPYNTVCMTLIIKPTRCTDFLKFYFGMKLCMFRTIPIKLCMFRTIPLSIIRSFSPCNQKLCMSYRFVDSFRAGSGCVRWETPDHGQRNCRKHVQFLSKIKLEKISASSWFNCKDLWRCTVTCHDARSHERKKTTACMTCRCNPV